jgi:hypothetical protein
MGMVSLIYITLTLAFAATAAFKGFVGAGFYCLASSYLAVLAMGGSVLGLRSHGASYRLGTPIAGLAGVVLAFWLATGFSFSLFGLSGSGPVWVIFGCCVGLAYGFSKKPLS